MQHLEFIDRDHFEYEYRRNYVKGELSQYIDFCWQTNFDNLFKMYPEGFSDVLFPNIGYTYIINIGTPFTMQLEKTALQVKDAGFIPRHQYVTCRHTAGNELFGIKFKVCPVVFEKEIDFSEYVDHIYPLSYLIDHAVIEKIRESSTFEKRVDIVFKHYNRLVQQYKGKLNYAKIVTEIINESIKSGEYNRSIEDVAGEYGVSKRTLQRYFKATTSYSSKQALQTMRIRQAVLDLTTKDNHFDYSSYGYYDLSHFLKHLKQFTGEKYYKHFSMLLKEAAEVK